MRGQLSDVDRRRIADAVADPAFLGLVNAEKNRNMYQARAFRSLEHNLALLLEDVRAYAREVGVER